MGKKSYKKGKGNFQHSKNRKNFTKKPQNGAKSGSKKDASESEGFEEVQPKEVVVKDEGFPTRENSTIEKDEGSDTEYKDTRNLVMQQNRKKKKSGGFQSMGLSYTVYKGVIRKGYKIPTPIQRKVVPLIMDGKDVVAMARTGSGKTAAFLIPMYEKLKVHSTSGVRALIMSPTRELALQTLKFTKELGKYTGLKSAVILGGDKMDDQFAALHENPDIIIATPGRFMHVLIEMEMKLQSVEYVVFDEADRLFEMGFAEQLNEILQRLPEARQTVLFSATLPKLLVDFAKAGLHDPTLIRLDVDTKLSEQLKVVLCECRSEDKTAILLHLLKHVVKPTEQTVVFLATKHHVEYLNMILQEAGITCSYTYSSLDQTARKINVGKFRNKKTMVLLVTDLAARGIDIPMLDNVINYNFPAKPKLFVHRVGRVARAGRTGTAYSFVSPDEVSYVLDLHLFLGRSMSYVAKGRKYPAHESGLYGRVPQNVIDNEQESLTAWHEKIDLQNMKQVISNAYKLYIKSRPTSSSESIKRAKELAGAHINLGFHPVFVQNSDKEVERSKLLDQMRNFRPPTTIFEINSSKKTSAMSVMHKQRSMLSDVIVAESKKRLESRLHKEMTKAADGQSEGVLQEMSTDTDLQEAFSTVVAPKRPAFDKVYEPKKKKRKSTAKKDEEFYIEYRPKDFSSEMGLKMGTSFEHQAADAVFDLAGDDEKASRISNQMKWDRKRKKFVRVTGHNQKKKIKTESGAWISATYKTNLYKDWLDKNKVEEKERVADDSDDEGRHNTDNRGGKRNRGPKRKHEGGDALPPAARNKFKATGNKRELKRNEQILKERRKKAKVQSFQKHREGKNKKKTAMMGKRR